MIEQVSDFEKQKIIETLEQNKWNRSKTARELKMTRKQLIGRINKYGID